MTLQASPAGQAPRLLRRRRPGRRGRRAALEQHGAPVYVRKQIVHNMHVVETLTERGAIFVDDTDEVPEGAIVVFSAHGVSPAVHEQAARRGSCARSTPPARWSPRCTRRRSGSPARATTSCWSGTRATRRSRAPRARRPSTSSSSRPRPTPAKVTVRDPEKVVWLSQTTLSVDETMETVGALRERLPGLQNPPSDDICYATQNRQTAVKAMAPQCDLVLVVGSVNSSNSVRLVEVALQAGAGAVVPHRLRPPDRRGLARRRRARSASPAARRCPRCSCAVSSSTWPSAGGPTSRSSRPPRRR